MSNSTSLIVRRAVPGDGPQIAECLCELGYSTSVGLVAERLAEWAASTSGVVFIAVDAATNQVIGAASLHVIPLVHVRGSLARLTALAVRSAAQRRGAGRALVAAAAGGKLAVHSATQGLCTPTGSDRVDVACAVRIPGL